MKPSSIRLARSFEDRVPPQLMRLLGVSVVLLVLYAALLVRTPLSNLYDKHQNIAEDIGLYGLPTVGVGVLIVSGGIDLSIGSVIALGAVCFGLMLESHDSEWVVRILAAFGGLDLGLVAFLLLTKRGVISWLSVPIALLLGAGCAVALDLAGPALFALLFALLSLVQWFSWWAAALVLLVTFLILLKRGLRIWLSGLIALLFGAAAQVALHLLYFAVRESFVPLAAALVVVWGSMHIGLCHGLLVTKLRLQPFLVTLCGLFIYRGLAKWLSPDHSPGLNVADAPEAFQRQVEAFKWLLVGDVFGVPNQLLWLVLIAVLLGLFLHGTRHGRYLFAIGANEEAARYAGIPTEGYKLSAYLISSTLAGLTSLLFVTYNNTVNPTSGGSWWELYAITGAVLGGCSLRGGEGSVAGMFLGAAVLPVLRQLCYTYGIKSELEYAVIGAALLLGTIVDELLKSRSARRG